MSWACASLLMGILLCAASGSAEAGEPRVLVDFPSSLQTLPWTTVNDNVMGGRSQGDFRRMEGRIVFAGRTNTNGGGFSSIRSGVKSFRLGSYDGVRVRVRGDGRTYTFRLTTSDTRRGRMQPSFWATFETQAGTWQVIDVPFSRFHAQWRGRRLAETKLDPEAIDSLGLMIYDKRDGRFQLEVDWIAAYRSAAPFSMATYRWKKRPLLLFAPSAGDVSLVAQLTEVGNALAAFNERDMALVVVLEKGQSEADGQEIPGTAGARLRSHYGVPAGQFALRLVGKDGGVKRRANAPVTMQTLFDQIDAMPMRQREMQDQRE